MDPPMAMTMEDLVHPVAVDDLDPPMEAVMALDHQMAPDPPEVGPQVPKADRHWAHQTMGVGDLLVVDHQVPRVVMVVVDLLGLPAPHLWQNTMVTELPPFYLRFYPRDPEDHVPCSPT